MDNWYVLICYNSCMPNKKIVAVFVCLTLFLSSLFLSVASSSSDELDNLNKEISDLTDALNQSIAATKPLESQLRSMQAQVAGIKASVSHIEQDIARKKADIEKGYKNLEKNEQLLTTTIRNYYIKSYYNSPFLILLSA